MDIAGFTQVLNNARRIVFFTGAGISTDSGIPDFRSPGGVWTKYTPVYYQDFLASETARVRYWRMKKELYETYKSAKPNQNHFDIALFEKRRALLGVITQNIDGFHHMAGISPEKIVELHGTDRKIHCLDCGLEEDVDKIFLSLNGEFCAPRCPACAGYLKVATISFGQPMPDEAMERAGDMCRASDLFIVLGSSLEVQPAATFPLVAKNGGAALCIVNRTPTSLDREADFLFSGSIRDFFKGIL